MKKRANKIYWKNELVGEIIEPKVDMFETYGEWKPVDNSIVNDFIREIEEKDGVIIRIDEFDPPHFGVVRFVPEEEISIKSYPNLSEHSDIT